MERRYGAGPSLTASNGLLLALAIIAAVVLCHHPPKRSGKGR